MFLLNVTVLAEILINWVHANTSPGQAIGPILFGMTESIKADIYFYMAYLEEFNLLWGYCELFQEHFHI